MLLQTMVYGRLPDSQRIILSINANESWSSRFLEIGIGQKTLAPGLCVLRIKMVQLLIAILLDH